MTPTDALIEKMARAMYRFDPVRTRINSVIPWEELDPFVQDWRKTIARAAYSAEHEEDGK